MFEAQQGSHRDGGRVSWGMEVGEVRGIVGSQVSSGEGAWHVGAALPGLKRSHMTQSN